MRLSVIFAEVFSGLKSGSGKTHFRRSVLGEQDVDVGVLYLGLTGNRLGMGPEKELSVKDA